MLYLLHFSRAYKHARHYLGWTRYNSPRKRLRQHRRGYGSPLVAAVAAAGIQVKVAKTWEGGPGEESRLKRGHNLGRLCPVCRAARLRKRRAYERMRYAKARAHAAGDKTANRKMLGVVEPVRKHVDAGAPQFSGRGLLSTPSVRVLTPQRFSKITGLPPSLMPLYKKFVSPSVFERASDQANQKSRGSVIPRHNCPLTYRLRLPGETCDICNSYLHDCPLCDNRTIRETCLRCDSYLKTFKEYVAHPAVTIDDLHQLLPLFFSDKADLKTVAELALASLEHKLVSHITNHVAADDKLTQGRRLKN